MNCLHCQKELVRRDGEGPTRFKNREYCDRQCSSEARIAANGGYSRSAKQRHDKESTDVIDNTLALKVITQAWTTGFTL